MALSKLKVLENGAQGDYWKIVSISVDKVSLWVIFSVDLYCSHEHSSSNKPSLNFKKSFSGVFAKEQLKGDLQALGYALIKSKVMPYVKSRSTVDENGNIVVTEETIHPDIDLEDAVDV